MENLKKTPRLQQLLCVSFLFSGVDPALSQDALADEDCVYCGFAPSERISCCDGGLDALGLLTAGRAAARQQHTGGQPVVLNTFASGDAFGVAAAFAGQDAPVTEVIALSPCKVLFLRKSLLRGLFAASGQIAENYITYLAGRIAYLNRRIGGFTAGSAENRLALYLEEAYRSAGEAAFVLPCSLTGLCSLLDVGRASLYRAFDALERAGALCREGRNVTILSPEVLHAFSPGPSHA